MNSNLSFEGKNLIICNYNNISDSKEKLKDFLKVDFELDTLKIVIFDEYLCPNKCKEEDYKKLNHYLRKIYGANLKVLVFTSQGDYDFNRNIGDIEIRNFQYLGIYGFEKFLHDRYLLILDANERKILKFFHLGHSILEILKFIFSDDNYISRKFSICDIYDEYVENYLRILLCESKINFEDIMEKLME